MSKDNSKGQRELLNNGIRAKDVRLIDDEGQNYGVVPTIKALQMAKERELDLVVVSPNQAPPVAKIMDFGKYKYEMDKRAKEAKKKQHTVEIKEVKIRYKIDVHDYNVRIKNTLKFISAGNKVKFVIMLRGREMQHAKLAFDLANRFLEDLSTSEIPMQIEKRPALEGRNVVLIIAPQA